jgi:hypothetical protein
MFLRNHKKKNKTTKDSILEKAELKSFIQSAKVEADNQSKKLLIIQLEDHTGEKTQTATIWTTEIISELNIKNRLDSV